MRLDRSRWSLARQLLVLQAAVAALVVALGGVLAYLDARRDSVALAQAQVRSVAEALAQDPTVTAALAAPDPTRELQPFAESVRLATRVDFVVLMSPEGIRLTHPDPARIGQRFLGTTAPALAGRTFTERFVGTLGPSVRAVAPVQAQPGEPPLGLVAVGITETRIADRLLDQLPALAAVIVLVLGLAAAGSLLVSRRLHRLTHGLGPAEVTRMYEHHEAVLRAVREGLLVLDRQRRVVLVNDEARRLLGLAGDRDVDGTRVEELGVPPGLGDLLVAGRRASDELHLTRDCVVVVNSAPIVRADRSLGTVTTLRDQSELQALTGELDSVRGFAEALRAQAHESANRLHAVVTMIELGRPEQAVEFATAELASAQELADRLLAAVEEPVLAALLLGKAAEAHERGVELVVDEDTALAGAPLPVGDLVTVVGNLVDNAVDAVLSAEPPRRVEVLVRREHAALLVRVRDTGRGIPPGEVEQVFVRGWSTKGGQTLHGRGLGLALVRQVVDRHHGTVGVGSADGGGAELIVRLPLAVGARP